uniref:BED-type domain-containing protein n=1 Tax=Panagrellus redivivus TaxID=6233 RepID=A0A7E4V7E4_PANRE
MDGHLNKDFDLFTLFLKSSEALSSSTTAAKSVMKSLKSKGRKSWVWQHYTKIAEKQVVLCTFCRKEIGAKNSNTTGMMRHLKSMHHVTEDTSSALPAELTSFQPPSTSFEAEFKVFVKFISTEVAFLKDILQMLLHRLHNIYLTVKENPQITQKLLELMEMSDENGLDKALIREVAAKHKIDTSVIEDASTLASCIFFGTVAMDAINTFIADKTFGNIDCFVAAEHHLIQAACELLVSPS